MDLIGHTWISSGFPYFLQFKSEFGNKEFMIWAIVSSWSCFADSVELSIIGCNKYHQFDFSIDHPVMSMCRVVSCVVGRRCLLWPVHPLGKTLLSFALLHFLLQGQTCLFLQVFLDFLFLHSSPLWWKGLFFFFFLVLVLEGLVGITEQFDFSFFGNRGWGIDLDYRNIEWFAWKWTEIIVIFEVASKHCISSSFVDCEGYSISSKGLFLTVVHVMVILIKFTHSGPF